LKSCNIATFSADQLRFSAALKCCTFSAPKVAMLLLRSTGMLHFFSAEMQQLISAKMLHLASAEKLQLLSAAMLQLSKH
jgi:hypothetical protein